jgi:S1-C subfamily serine protease
MWHHPGYLPGGGPSADVGIVQTAGSLSREVPLATMAELAELEAGDPVFLFGFSGDLSNVSSPVAGVATGQVRGITAFDGSQAPLPTAQVILHDIQGSPGTRGSPLFDASGRVVAIDEGGHAVRIDLLASLLAGMGR